MLNDSEIYQHPGYPSSPFQMFSTCVKLLASLLFETVPTVSAFSISPSWIWFLREIHSPMWGISFQHNLRILGLKPVHSEEDRDPPNKCRKTSMASASLWLHLRRKEIIKWKHRTVMSPSLTENHRRHLSSEGMVCRRKKSGFDFTA